MEPVQSSIKQRSSVFAYALSSLVSAVFLGLTGSFLTALVLALLLYFFVTVDFLGAALARFEITFLVTGFERGDEATDDDRVVLAFGILISWFVFVLVIHFFKILNNQCIYIALRVD